MKQVAVIGAGITGAFTAYLLSRSGHPVVLLDAETSPYRGTSCNPGGINPLHGPGLPHPMADFYLWSHALHSQHLDNVVASSGINYGFRVIERLFLAFTSREQQDLLAMRDTYNARENFRASWKTPEELAALEPRISGQALGGLMTYGNIVVDSELYCEALTAAAIKGGCRHLREDVCDFVTRDKRISHVVTANEQIECDAAVLATGYLTDHLCGKLGIHVPVTPLKGELLVIRVGDDPFAFDITRGGASGLYQFRDDLCWLGGTRSDPGEQPGITDQGRDEILQKCADLLPDIGRYEIVAHKVGYRPESADKLPVVGRLRPYQNLFVGTGGGSKGILLSAGIAAALTSMVEDSDDSAFDYLEPGRFDAS